MSIRPELGHITSMAIGRDRNFMVAGTNKGFIALFDMAASTVGETTDCLGTSVPSPTPRYLLLDASSDEDDEANDERGSGNDCNSISGDEASDDGRDGRNK